MGNLYSAGKNNIKKSAVISIIAARSNTGKTTLIEKLIEVLNDRNYKVGVLKHGTHKFEIDREDKDTYRSSKAGADNVIISNSSKMAIHKLIPKDILQ